MVNFRSKDSDKLDESKEQHRSMSVEELAEKGIKLLCDRIVDGDEAYKCLAGKYDDIKLPSEHSNDFYCGITNDLVDRKYKHEHEDYQDNEIECMYAVRCTSSDVASMVEDVMHSVGFNIGGVKKGGNGKADDSDYVYMYRIPK